MARIILLLPFLLALQLGQSQESPWRSWNLIPDYRLPGKADQVSTVQYERATRYLLDMEPLTFQWMGGRASHRASSPLSLRGLPGESFTMEFMVLHHVHRKAGLAMALRREGELLPDLVAGYRDGKAALWQAGTPDMEGADHWPLEKGFQRYGLHFTLVRDQGIWKLYQQGKLLGARRVLSDDAAAWEYLDLILYAEEEPEMCVEDLVREVRVYPRAMRSDEIEALAQQAGYRLQSGLTGRQHFHFMAGPYLYGGGNDHMHLLVETDRAPTRIWVEYGPDGRNLNFRKEAEVNLEGAGGSRIFHFRLDVLLEGTGYYYRVLAVAPEGDTIRSGLLTFKTAGGAGTPLTFGILSDTESRPFINHQVNLQLWKERPEFILHAGDLTDGGMQDHKFEWTWEYFPGMNALSGRVPVFPVPGNGEGDRYWYDRYHHFLPKPAYRFRWGDAEFFMMDSNRPEEFKPGGLQYRWLEDALRASTATWKIVCHHHAPWSSDEDDYGNTWEAPGMLGDPDMRTLWPLYEKFGVDLLVYGHLHTYQRTHPISRSGEVHPRGIRGLQVGGAGGNLEDFAPHRHAFSARSYRGYHYLLADVREKRLTIRAYDLEGRLIDQEEMVKP